MLTHYNLRHLIKIEVSDASESNIYLYKKEIKLFGIILRKAGVYHCFADHRLVLPENYFIKDNIVYECSRCTLFFSNKHKIVFYFNSYKEACNYSEKIRNDSAVWLEDKID